MMGWPRLARRTIALALACIAAVLIIGVALWVVLDNPAWGIIALLVDLGLGLIVLSREAANARRASDLTLLDAISSANDRALRRLDELFNESWWGRGLDQRIEPGEPLDMLRRELQRDVSALLSLRSLMPDGRRLPAPGGWAATPETLALLMDRIMTAPELRTVVELGSGSSTVWMALALSRRGGGHLVSIESDAEYATTTRSALATLGLSEIAEVRVAPLTEVEVGGESIAWYEGVRAADFGDVDLLFVDGPPGHTNKWARYPAVPLLASALSDTAWVVLDDVDRHSEQEIAERWLRERWSGVSLTQCAQTDRALVLSAAR